MLNDLEDVILFAALAHKEQKMVEPNVNYLAHVVGVASNVLEAYYNGDEEFDLNYALKLAILHDVIEDTDINYEKIEEIYGTRIADGVAALTKDELLEKSQRIKDAVRRIKKYDNEVAIVKLADRAFNMRCAPKSWDQNHCESYLKDAKIILEELGYSNKYLKSKLSGRIEKYNKD